MPALGSQLLLAFLFVSVGFVGGALVCLWWFESQKQPSETAHKSSSGKSENEEIVKFLRDRSSRNLLIELGGKTYSSSKMLNAGQRQELAKLLPELSAWTHTETDMVTQPNLAVTASESEASHKASESLLAERMAAVIPQPAAPLPSVPQPPAPQTPARTGLTGPLPRLSAAAPLPGYPHTGLTGPLPALSLSDKPAKTAASKSIVAQINDILQDKIPGTTLDKRGIYLAEDLHHGVIVWIGQEHYSGIDTVPDAEVQSAIRSAVSEWERLTEKSRSS